MAETREEKLIESNRLIECTGCFGVQSAFVSTTATVYVKKQRMGTLNDVKPNTNIINFPGNCMYNMYNPCAYAPKGTWQESRETITTEKQQPLTEQSSYLECALGGKITFSKTSDAWDPPENIVDKAQSKINKAANYVTKKMTEVAQAASDAIGGIADAAKKAGGFLKNENVTDALQSTSDFVDDVDSKKAGLDVSVANLDIRLNNLRKELKQLLTGQEQELKDLMTVEDVQQTDEGNNTSVATTEEEENSYNQEYFNEENEKAVNEFLSGINDDIDTLNDNASRLDPNKDYNIIVDENSADSTRFLTDEPTPQVTENSTVSNATNESTNQTENIVDQIEAANDALSEYGVTTIDSQDEAKVRQSLAILDDLSKVISKDGIQVDKITNIPAVSETINVERDELNTKVQAEVNELLKEIEYVEKLKKYNEESGELQEDLDKAAATLDVLGDFNAFIDGIAANHFDKVLKKYKKTMDQLGGNMKLLNTSMGGLSYMAGGFTAGDVITNVPLKDKKDSDNDEGDEDGSGAGLAGNIFGSLQDVLNDRNEEPKILRIYAIYAQDPEEGENYKKGDIITADSILPGIKVDLIILANGKANGAIVDLDLQERSFHYDPIDSSGRATTRTGLFEKITLQGDSPNFEKGGNYDLNDPNFAIDPEPVGRRELKDKTTINFISRLPIEEELEEPLTST